VHNEETYKTAAQIAAIWNAGNSRLTSTAAMFTYIDPITVRDADKEREHSRTGEQGEDSIYPA